MYKAPLCSSSGLFVWVSVQEHTVFIAITLVTIITCPTGLGLGRATSGLGFILIVSGLKNL